MRSNQIRPSQIGASIRSRIEPWRLLLALLVVAAIGAVLWLWGRPLSDPPQAEVVVTSEYWIKGAATAGFQLVSLPVDIAERFAEPAALVGAVAAVDIPAGVYVARSQLVAKSDIDPDSELAAQTRMSFAANFSPWPQPPPSAGDWAVIATKPGGCALHVLQLAAASDSTVVLTVNASLAKELSEVVSRQPLVLWQSPSAGWPACSGGQVGPTGAKTQSTATTPRPQAS